MIYVVRQQPSDGANAICKALGGKRIRTDLGVRRMVKKFNPAEDYAIMWGAHVPGLPPTRTLNNIPVGNKIRDAQILRDAGVPTIVFHQGSTPPPVQPVADPAAPLIKVLVERAVAFTSLPKHEPRNPVYYAGLQELYSAVGSALNMPPKPQAAEWLPRVANHIGGNDLLRPLNIIPDYWVQKEDIRYEYRVHTFAGASIRGGKKVPRANALMHPWIRSWDGGWKISYDGVSLRQAMRDLAHMACATLGLTFGAVDIGQLADGRLIVLEVNRAPGVEAGTIDAYARAIRRNFGIAEPATPAVEAA